ncbi:very short patch repair endonuclease [Granulicella sibirica]|uniref:Very short patch repair endonuclease n=1 Tax=Granulicella sibirica TaxID=2479048 RepID=A0A4Q0T410_9BACT|nr:very short patch repair endonuclease [Granulicella sibirica]RXH56719.1 Very-short-patch mismatch repair endonuclease (G-T specific) [Granulicella sibirica]
MIRPTPQRSAIMRAVKAKDTAPEIQVRRFVHALGYRYRLHRKDLPGKPDMVFPKQRKVIFVHGCFWHGHSCKRGDRTPQTNREYWEAKIDRNRKRDSEHHKALESLGWQTLVVWECQLRDSLERRRIEGDIAEYLCENKVLAKAALTS